MTEWCAPIPQALLGGIVFFDFSRLVVIHNYQFLPRFVGKNLSFLGLHGV
jgi:hypothetical protein